MFKGLSANMQVLVFIFLVYIMSTIGSMIYSLALLVTVGETQLISLDSSDPRVFLSYALFFQISAFLMSFLVLLRLTGQRFKDLVYIGPVQLKLIGLTLMICLGSLLLMPFFSSINEIFKDILPSAIIEREIASDIVNKKLMFHSNGVQFIFSLIVIGLLPAICEELVFRGFLIGKIREAGGTDYAAIAISAVIFALTHFQPLKFLPMFFFGLCLGYVYLKFKNLKYSILMHFLINGIQITIGFLVGSGLINIDI